MKILTRRECLSLGVTTLAGVSLINGAEASEPNAAPRRPVAGIVTVYRHNSHADVILTKILQGWEHDGGPGPALRLASLYVDQFPRDDMARQLSKKFDVPIFDTIERAVTVGGNRVAVDGVISIGEHGDYPTNKLGQTLYPRRRFFAEIAATLEKRGRVVPVFSDKHLGPAWEDARWMYDRAMGLKIPLMAGSSLPVSYRSHDIRVPMGCELEAAVGIGYSGLDIYGSHALDCYQCFVERRRNAERGVRSVQFLEGAAMWRAVDDGLVAKDVLQAAFDIVAKPKVRDMRSGKDAALFLFEYLDGFRGALFMLQNVTRTAIAIKLKGQRPMATSFEERTEPRLLRARGAVNSVQVAEPELRHVPVFVVVFHVEEQLAPISGGSDRASAGRDGAWNQLGLVRDLFMETARAPNAEREVGGGSTWSDHARSPRARSRQRGSRQGRRSGPRAECERRTWSPARARSTQISPPCMRTSEREIDRPRPVPPYLRVSPLCTCSKLAKHLSHGLPARCRCRRRHRRTVVVRSRFQRTPDRDRPGRPRT